MVVTSYCRNKNLDDIKKTKGRPIIEPAIAMRLLITTSSELLQYARLEEAEKVAGVGGRRVSGGGTEGESNF